MEMEKKSKKTQSVRLNVFIQAHGLASRRKADELILSGLVKVNGKVVKALGSRVEKTDEIVVAGKKLKKRTSKFIYLFHKPYLTITSRNDERGRPTIFDLAPLKKLPGNVQPVGRLDFKSEGLLILTNDGELALTLSHPKYSVEKVYSVLLSTQVSVQEIEKLKTGIELEDGLAKPLYVKSLNREKFGNSLGQWLEIAVGEGRNRLVRRMMEALGLKVVRLVRVSIGHIRLPANLSPGKLRLVTEHEKKYLNELKKNLVDPSVVKKTRKKNATSLEEKAEKKVKKTKSLSPEPYAKKVLTRQKKTQALARNRKNSSTI